MKQLTLTIKGKAPMLMHSDRFANPLDLLTKAHKELTAKRMAMGVQYVNTALLDGDQRRRNADAQAKITMLAGMQRTVVNDLTGTAGQP